MRINTHHSYKCKILRGWFRRGGPPVPNHPLPGFEMVATGSEPPLSWFLNGHSPLTNRLWVVKDRPKHLGNHLQPVGEVVIGGSEPVVTT